MTMDMPGFEDLARMTQPTMMPETSDAFRGLMFGMDKNRQQGFLEQAAMSAKLKAAMQAMQAEEQARGSPGRNADIDVKNALAEAAKGDLGTSVNTANETRGLGLDKARQGRKDAELKKMEQWTNAWDAAGKDDAAKKSIYDEMDSQNVEFAGKRIGDAPIEKVDSLMKRLRASQTNTPKEESKELDRASKEKMGAGRDKTAIEVATIRANASKLIAQNRITTAEQHKTEKEKLLKEYSDNGYLPEHKRALLDALLATPNYGAEVRAATAKPTPKLVNGKVVMETPTAPPPPRTPPNMGTGAPPGATPMGKKMVGDKEYEIVKGADGTLYANDGGKWRPLKGK